MSTLKTLEVVADEDLCDELLAEIKKEDVSLATWFKRVAQQYLKRRKNG